MPWLFGAQGAQRLFGLQWLFAVHWPCDVQRQFGMPRLYGVQWHFGLQRFFYVQGVLTWSDSFVCRGSSVWLLGGQCLFYVQWLFYAQRLFGMPCLVGVKWALGV